MDQGALFVRVRFMMKENPTEPVTNAGKHCHNPGSAPFSLETLIEHRRFKTSSWKHLRNTPDGNLVITADLRLFASLSAA